MRFVCNRRLGRLPSRPYIAHPRALLIVAVACFAFGRATAQEATDRPLGRAEGETEHTATLADAEWLVGSWRGTGLGGTVDEVWLPREGSAMVGVFRLSRDGEVNLYEIMTLVERDGGLVLELKHFGADLKAWEAPDETLRFPLLKTAADTLYFDGLTYARTGPDRLQIWLAMTQRDGSVRDVPFELRRWPLPPSRDD